MDLMAHTLTETVHVDLRVNGIQLGGSFGPGTVELPAEVAELLVAQGYAKPAKKTSKTDESTPEA